MLISEVNDSMKSGTGLISYDWPLIHVLNDVENSFNELTDYSKLSITDDS
jgi:hypothetical protein